MGKQKIHSGANRFWNRKGGGGGREDKTLTQKLPFLCLLAQCNNNTQKLGASSSSNHILMVVSLLALQEC